MVSAIVKTDPHNYKSSVVSKSQGMLWPIISQNRITSVTTQYLSLFKALDSLLGRMLKFKLDLDQDPVRLMMKKGAKVKIVKYRISSYSFRGHNFF